MVISGKIHLQQEAIIGRKRARLTIRLWWLQVALADETMRAIVFSAASGWFRGIWVPTIV